VRPSSVGRKAAFAPLRLRTAALTAVGGLLVLAITITALVANQAGDASRTRLTNLYLARSTVDGLLIGMVNQETGVRGFTLVNNPEFLQPYNEGASQRITAVSGLAQLSLSGQEQGQLATTLADVDRWVAWSEARLAVLQATTGVRTDTSQSTAGKLLFDTFRGDLSILTAEIDVSLRAATDQANRTATIVYAVVATTAAASLALFLLLGLRLGRAEDQARRTGEALRESQNLLEQRVVERTAELKAANEELETFSYSVSHDLRAPLRGIDGYSLALLEDYAADLPPTAQGYLNRLRLSAQRLGRLIDDMLELSRVNRQPLDLRRVDLTAVAESVVDELRTADPARSAIVTIEDHVTGWGDPGLVRRVLQNLLGNAWKYTSTRETAHIDFGVTSSRGAPAFFVKDDGVGFDMAYASKLFSPFQRLHREDEFPGTGVGLATVQRIIGRHGREAWIESILGGGTSVFFTLPPQKEDLS
jgi:signal transduction histidine kinase